MESQPAENFSQQSIWHIHSHQPRVKFPCIVTDFYPSPQAVLARDASARFRQFKVSKSSVIE
jgi:hypothetical protein